MTIRVLLNGSIYTPADPYATAILTEHGTVRWAGSDAGARSITDNTMETIDLNGQLVTVTMGSYGIGVSRIVAAVAEITCDDKGLSWPVELAPYQVQVMVTGKGQEMFQAAEDLAGKLSDLGFDVLYDDRKASPGVKFTDAEMLGMPVAVVIGRGLANGLVEVRNRRTGEKREVPVTDAVAAVRELAEG